MHISISKLNGLSPGHRQAIIWTIAGILLIGPLGTNSSEILIEMHTFSFKKMHLNMSSGKWRPFYLGLNVLKGLAGSVLHVVLWNLVMIASGYGLVSDCIKPKPIPKLMLTSHLWYWLKGNMTEKWWRCQSLKCSREFSSLSSYY